jgi:hypothetical protein
MPQNPENIFVAMLALLAFASPAQADLINHTYWAYIPNPPLLQVVEWTDLRPVDPLMTQYICLLLGAWRGPLILRKKED